MWFGGRNDRDNNPIAAIMAVIVLILAPLVARAMQMTIGRKRESLADSSGVEMTRYPPGLISALEKLQDDRDSLQNQISENNGLININIGDIEGLKGRADQDRLNIDELLEKGLKDEKPVEPTKFGKGAGATEVPRGILFHEYEYDSEGFCTMGNCIIPTGQNHANIQCDMEKLVPEMLAADKTEAEMELTLEMLVRAYDPCISCSTHYLDVTFKK